MGAEQLTFTLGNVISIIVFITTAVTMWYGLKRSVDRAIMISKQHKSELEEFKLQVDKKESQIYSRIEEIKKEQHDSSQRLWEKLEVIADAQVEMKVCLAKITGVLETINKKK
jgi:hypothetical protein